MVVAVSTQPNISSQYPPPNWPTSANSALTQRQVRYSVSRRKVNRYSLGADVAVLYCPVAVNGRKKTTAAVLIDRCDLEKVLAAGFWRVYNRAGKHHAMSGNRSSLSRLIANPGKGLGVSFVNRRGTDCRRANLRVETGGVRINSPEARLVKRMLRAPDPERRKARIADIKAKLIAGAEVYPLRKHGSDEVIKEALAELRQERRCDCGREFCHMGRCFGPAIGNEKALAIRRAVLIQPLHRGGRISFYKSIAQQYGISRHTVQEIRSGVRGAFANLPPDPKLKTCASCGNFRAEKECLYCKLSKQRAKAAANRSLIHRWIKRRPCVQCGMKPANRQLVRKDGSKSYGGLRNLCQRKVLAYLKECDVYCRFCFRRNFHGTDVDAIKAALMEFKTARQIQAELHTSVRVISKISHELYRAGHVCLCGKRLAHQVRCSFYKGKRSSQATVVAPPVVKIEAPDRCTGNKACPFPIFKNGLCKHHHQFFAFTESMTDSGLEFSDYHATEKNQFPKLRVANAWELNQYSNDNVFRTERNL
jgi:hypothetical protein